LTEFGSLKKKQNEFVLDFIKIFNKLYNRIPTEVKPSQPTVKIAFVVSFDPYFSLLLRERRSTTLIGMQDDVLEIESNMITSRNAKIRSESGEREKIKQKEQVGTLGTNKIQDDKIEEMSRLNKDLSNKLDKMKTKRRRHGNRNPN
jgi:hypothetical protein